MPKGCYSILFCLVEHQMYVVIKDALTQKNPQKQKTKKKAKNFSLLHPEVDFQTLSLVPKLKCSDSRVISPRFLT